jgi:hypothetical protein
MKARVPSVANQADYAMGQGFLQAFDGIDARVKRADALTLS